MKDEYVWVAVAAIAIFFLGLSAGSLYADNQHEKADLEQAIDEAQGGPTYLPTKVDVLLYSTLWDSCVERINPADPQALSLCNEFALNGAAK